MRHNPWISGPWISGPWIRRLSAAALLVALCGCGETRQALGLDKDPPDEFQVVERAPLSLPPDFNLRPPQPGVPRPQEGTARDQAENALFGEASQTNRMQTALFGDLAPGGALGGGQGGAYGTLGGPSAGELAFLADAGATNVDPSIRRTIDRETLGMAQQNIDFIERLVFWRDPEPFGTVVDPAKEQQRLQENAALGRPANEGGTPTIERKRPALLEGLF